MITRFNKLFEEVDLTEEEKIELYSFVENNKEDIKKLMTQYYSENNESKYNNFCKWLDDFNPDHPEFY